jgi:demethylmenaquinone methyltransferase/2-methoxy-6-polyprenyl-1,4-benzoquinol methylase
MHTPFLESALKKLAPGATAVFIDITLNEYFRREPCYYDGDGNRLSMRQIPDGSEYEVVKNFPSQTELERIIGPYGQDFAYYEFDELTRWLISFKKPS